MRFWSEGLGDRQLVMGLGKAKIESQGDMMLLSGVVDSPAPWEFEVRVERADWATILDTAISREACGYIATHASAGLLASMACSVIRFVALLAWFRVVRFLRLSDPAPARAVPVEHVPAAAEK